MATFRSRALPVAGQAQALVEATTRGHDGVAAVMADLQSKLAAAREEGRQQGIKEAQARTVEAERRAKEATTKAEAAAETKVKAKTAELEQGLGAALTALRQAQERIAAIEKQLVANAEAEVVRLAMATAARILHREIEVEPAWMVDLVAAALREVPDRRGVVVRMHPEDAAVAREHQERIAAGIPGLDRLAIQDDPTLGKGACILASQGTRIDASVASSWERVTAALLAAAPIQPLQDPPPAE
jgi:flagellar assembly protein FliH